MNTSVSDRTNEEKEEKEVAKQETEKDFDQDVWLDDIWSLYHHGSSDTNWTYDSYHRVACISTAFQYWMCHRILIEPCLTTGMFFLFREHVFPCWDDPHNIGGGCVSVKVPIEHAATYWADLVSCVLSEELSVPPDCTVTGVSCSPRNYFCIFKAWLSREVYDLQFMPPGYTGAPMFKTNRDNITLNNAVLAAS
jgi:hypothetical protein